LPQATEFYLPFFPGTSAWVTAGQFFIMKVPAKSWKPNLFYCRQWCAFGD